MDTEIRLLELDVEIGLTQQAIRLKELDDPTNSWDEFCEYMKPEWDKLGELDREKRMLMTPKLTDREFDADGVGRLVSRGLG